MKEKKSKRNVYNHSRVQMGTFNIIHESTIESNFQTKEEKKKNKKIDNFEMWVKQENHSHGSRSA